MSNEAELDRNEDATPHKRDEAHRRGQVARSAEVTSALVLGAALVYLHARGWQSLRDLFRFDRMLLAAVQQATAGDATINSPWLLVEFGVRAALGLLLPLLAVVVITAILGNMAQTGPVLSFHPVQPDWSRINPVTGFKRVMSLRTLFDGGRACVKWVVLAAVTWFAICAIVPQFQQLASLTPWGYLQQMLADVGSVGMKLVLALGVIAAVDLGHAKREFAKNLRMSRREVREEHKHREGDPRIRARLRELRREALKRSRTLRRTAEADVVLTNPTHFAVALRYRHGQMSAPVVVSKGAGVLAAAIRKIASHKCIPVVRNPVLARALHAQVDIDDAVPPQLYGDVARVMVWVLAMREAGSAQRRSAGATP